MVIGMKCFYAAISKIAAAMSGSPTLKAVPTRNRQSEDVLPLMSGGLMNGFSRFLDPSPPLIEHAFMWNHLLGVGPVVSDGDRQHLLGRIQIPEKNENLDLEAVSP
jgi:hypothetical protein